MKTLFMVTMGEVFPNDAAGIEKRFLGVVKRNTMFVLIRQVLFRVPFKPYFLVHPYYYT